MAYEALGYTFLGPLPRRVSLRYLTQIGVQIGVRFIFPSHACAN